MVLTHLRVEDTGPGLLEDTGTILDLGYPVKGSVALPADKAATLPVSHSAH